MHLSLYKDNLGNKLLGMNARSYPSPPPPGPALRTKALLYGYCLKSLGGASRYNYSFSVEFCFGLWKYINKWKIDIERG